MAKLSISDADQILQQGMEVEPDIADTSISEIRKNLLSDLSEVSPVKGSDGCMLPPPIPPSISDKMTVYLRLRPLKDEEVSKGEDQVRRRRYMAYLHLTDLLAFYNMCSV